MSEVKGVERKRRTQLLDDLRNRRRHWKLRIEIDGNDSLSIGHKEEIHIFDNSMVLLISSIIKNNDTGVPKDI